jgi:hypothetical protein
MIEIAVLAVSIKSTLHEIAKQSSALGVGLQNAAPGEKVGTPNNTIQYLLETSDNLNQKADECDKILSE